MHDHELKELWQAQRIESAPPLPNAKQLTELKERVNRLNRTLFWRDCRENMAALFVIGCFGYYFFTVPNLLARVGSFLVILSSLLIIAYPIWRKRQVPKAAPDAAMMDSLESELRHVRVEIALTRSVHWWYIIPGTPGLLLFIAGISESIAAIGVWVLFVIALDVFLYWINQVACDKKFLPMKRELESLLRTDGSLPAPEIPGKYTMAKMIMLLSVFFGILLAGYLLWVETGRDETLRHGKSSPPATIDYSDPTSQMLEAIRVEHKLPALAAALVRDGNITITNVVGFRREKDPERAIVNDKFHIGSVTKSMTATVAAMLVEQDKISWTTTIGELFPEDAEQLHPIYRDVTLEQLLAHRGGAPGDAPRDLWIKAWNAKGTPAQQRLSFVKAILARKPATKPGRKYIYSNQGYAIAGVMLEKATGKTWEELMQTMLFEPLGMASAGFGAPATTGQVDQPWGHTKGLFSTLKAVPPGPGADNPAAIGPAGAVHCSIEDLAKYAAFHLAGAHGEGQLLKPETFKKLHAAVGDDYALGWMVLERKWASGRALMHNGSNTMFYVVFWLAPERNCAVIVATNVGGTGAFLGCDKAATKLIQQMDFR